MIRERDGLWRSPMTMFAVVCAITTVACRTTTEGPAEPWDISRAENLVWQPDDSRFSQDFALETSGLAHDEGKLWAASEKYARLLVMSPGSGPEAEIVDVQVPIHAELEGLAVRNGRAYLCDEAHAAVYRVDLEDGIGHFEGTGAEPLVAVELPLVDVEVEGGKIGVEGIEISLDGAALFLLLERTGDESRGCASRIWRLHIEKGTLRLDGDPLEIALEDCNWRLTGLAWDGPRLLGLKTQYPGERYEVVEIDTRDGSIVLVQDLTTYLREVRDDGWGNNVEGIAIDDDGALWLIGDNAVTGVIDDPYPPPTDEKALLLRIPRRK